MATPARRMHVKDKFPIPLSYPYKEGDAGEICMDAQMLADMLLQLRRGEEQDNCPEKACILGSNAAGEIVRFHVDTEGIGGRTSYLPNTAGLEQVIRMWKIEYAVAFAGLIHTHPHKNALALSPKDLLFTKALLALNPGLQRIVMGILAGGELALYCFDRDFLRIYDRNKEG